MLKGALLTALDTQGHVLREMRFLDASFCSRECLLALAAQMVREGRLPEETSRVMCVVEEEETDAED